MLSGLKAVLIDFGGVIAEEGFYLGLMALGRRNGLEPEAFFTVVDGLIYETGYLIGAADEAAFWNAVRRKTGITGNDAELKNEILSRFVIRPAMIVAVDSLRSKGLTVAMLSDQTDWLEEIDRQTALFQHFDRVFNSYRLHKSKRDASIFREVCGLLTVKPEQVLFVDDNINHINRARNEGLQTIHFVSTGDFMQQIGTWFKSV